MDKLQKIGIIGTGHMAATMMTAFKQMPNVKVDAVMSTSHDRAKNFANRYGITSSFSNLEKLLSEPSIRAIYVANRTTEHAHVTIAALKAGKAVLCEKPFAIDVREGQAVISTARSTGQLFMEAIWTSFLPAYQRMQKLVQSGSFGRVTHLYFDFGYPIRAEDYPQLFMPLGGGVLLDRGVYGITLALRLLGSVKKVDAILGVNGDGIDVDASLQLTHKCGGQSQLGFSLTSLMSNRTMVACEEGAIGLMPPTIGAESVYLQRMNAGGPFPKEAKANGIRQLIVQQMRRNSFLRRTKAALSGPEIENHPFGVNPYLPQLHHFIHLLRNERSESSVNTMDSSLAILKIIEAAKNAH